MTDSNQQDKIRATVEKMTADIRTMEINANHTGWDAATTGTPEALNAAAEARARAEQRMAEFKAWCPSMMCR